MKQMLALLVLFALFIALTPAIAFLAPDRSDTPAVSDGLFDEPDGEDQTDPAPQHEFVLLDEATGENVTVAARDYVIGAVLCEMPASYESEALKAQAVAAYTYALYVQQLREREPLPELNGASFTVNSETYTGWTTAQHARRLLGTEFMRYYNKVADAVDAVLGETLCYNGEPICACYHAISPGRTENSENVFTTALPYLVSVDSGHDITAEGYETKVELTASELDDRLRTGRADYSASGGPDEWLGGTTATEAGTVLAQEIGGYVFTGTELRTMLGLRSAAFTAEYADGIFTFTVHGYGHGVGMSQHGANALAAEGRTYAEILAHYYTGTELHKE